MSDEQGSNHDRAMSWFDGLEPIPQAFALTEIEGAEHVMLVSGLITRGIGRDEAKRLVMAGPVRRAPRGQQGDASLCGLVVVDPATGYPVQIQTRPL